MQSQKTGAQPATKPTDPGERFSHKPGDQLEKERNRQNPEKKQQTERPRVEEDSEERHGGIQGEGSWTNAGPGERPQKDSNQDFGRNRRDEQSNKR